MDLIKTAARDPDDEGRQRVVVVVTHDSRVYDFGDRIVSMADGRIEDHTSLAKPGDKVVLRAEMDLIAVGSACPMEGGVNGERLTGIRFVVRDA